MLAYIREGVSWLLRNFLKIMSEYYIKFTIDKKFLQSLAPVSNLEAKNLLNHLVRR